MRTSLFAALTLASSVALASHGPLVAGTQHAPQRFVDESQTLLSLHGSHSVGHGYVFHLSTVLIGHSGRSSDTLRLDWKSGGSVIASAKCDYNGGQVTCDSSNDHGLHARGPIVAQLVYEDDQDSKDYLIREFKVNVAQWTSFGDEVWQIVGDDLLGSAYARFLPNSYSSGIDRKVSFSFWTTAVDRHYDFVLRCKVNGATIPDIDAGGGGSGSLKADQVTRGTGAHTVYQWTHFMVTAQTYWGTKDNTHTASPYLIDHVGDWVCALRTDAKNVRELRFHVNDQGLIDSDAMATAGPPLADKTALVDLRIPAGTGFDLRLRPDAMRATRGFGLPWPDHANARAIRASMPPASGLPDPH